MTRLEELLERAAEVGPVGFTNDDIQDRVRRRGRVRRAAASGCFVLLMGLFALEWGEAHWRGARMLASRWAPSVVAAYPPWSEGYSVEGDRCDGEASARAPPPGPHSDA